MMVVLMRQQCPISLYSFQVKPGSAIRSWALLGLYLDLIVMITILSAILA